MNILPGFLLIVSLVLVQCLIGGTRFVFSFPCYALVGVAAALSVFSLRRAVSKPAALCVGSAILLAGYVIVRAWLSPIPYLARQDLFLAPAALAVYLLSAYCLTTTRARLWVVGTLLAVGVAHVLVGMAQFQWRNGFMLFGFLRDDNTPRASGMLISGNHLAGYLEAMALLALGLTVWSRMRVGMKLLTGYLVLLFYFGVILSGSRGGYLSSIISLAAFGALTLWIIRMYNRRILTLALIVVLAGGVLAVGGAAHAMKRNHFLGGRMTGLSHATEDVRVYNWLASLDQFKLSPAVGTGAGTHLYYGRLLRRPQIQTDPVHSHSDYLEMLAEYGLIGEALALVFLATHLLHGLVTVREITLRRLCNSLTSARSDTLALTVGAIAAVVALAAHSVVDFNMHIPGNALLFAFLFGILANPGRERPREAAWISPTALVRGGLCALGIALLAGVAVKYRGESLAEKARVALRDRDYQACIELAQKSIAADPTNPYAYFHLGDAFRTTATVIGVPPLRTVLFEKAVDAYRLGLKRFPHDENLLVRLGQALDGARRFDEAEAAYTDAIGHDPQLGVLYAYYGAHLKLLGQEDAAKANIQKAGQLGTQAPHTIGMDEVQSILLTPPEKIEGDIE
ncbi:MAG: O-antigen ligase family protein [Chthoniobacteraceae bacterium]|nr:O-antigen ligase family protein [Chthoniobacteraceae bacterium]